MIRCEVCGEMAHLITKKVCKKCSYDYKRWFTKENIERMKKLRGD